MARLVVLRFEDNEDADLFAAWDHNRDNFSGNVQTVGLWALPTQFCEGSLAHGCTGYRRFGRFWTTGKKFGWVVCRVCKKPARPKSNDSLVRNIVSRAVNLLFPDQQDVPSVFDAGWGAYRNDTQVPDSYRDGSRDQYDGYVPPRMEEV
jgi:hypothetical protein